MTLMKWIGKVVHVIGEIYMTNSSIYCSFIFKFNSSLACWYIVRLYLSLM